MSQVTHPRISHPVRLRPSHTVWLGALLALAAGAAVALVLALGGEASDNATPVSSQAQPSLRSDGGPEESSVAAAVAPRPAAGPNEAGTAASLATPPPATAGGPDESRTAAAVGTNPPPTSNGPDESRTAASISGR